MLPDYDFVLEASRDPICLYAKPEKDTRYTIGVDAATGFGKDFTSIQVWSNRIPFEQVCWLRSKIINTVEGSDAMVRMGKYYNDALLVIESRHPGNAYVDNALDVYHYKNVYQREKHLHEETGLDRRYGICTTDADKHLLINTMKRSMENPDGAQVIFHDPLTVEEFMNFVYIEDKRKTGAAQGFNDDTVMAAMLAVHGCSMYPQEPKAKKTVKELDENEAHQRYLLDKHMKRMMQKPVEV